MAFHDGFVSQLVGRTAVIDRDGNRAAVRVRVKIDR